MSYSEKYEKQVRLLIRAIPFVAQENCFALVGGTAINLFIRDFPRLSVDIDLHYLPVHDRSDSLNEIDGALKRIAVGMRKSVARCHIHESKLNTEDAVTKLIVRHEGVQIKIEVTPVIRGAVFEPEMRSVSHAVETEFGFAEIQVVSFADLYAGKIVAALDRQHPRDLFDIHNLYENEGISDDLRAAFVVYLLSHMRPTHEVLGASIRDIQQEYAQSFVGMTKDPVELKVLVNVGEELSKDMVVGMSDAHKQLLIDFTHGDPDWALLGLDGIKDLPAVRWKQINLAKLDTLRRSELANQIESVMERM